MLLAASAIISRVGPNVVVPEGSGATFQITVYAGTMLSSQRTYQVGLEWTGVAQPSDAADPDHNSPRVGSVPVTIPGGTYAGTRNINVTALTDLLTEDLEDAAVAITSVTDGAPGTPSMAGLTIQNIPPPNNPPSVSAGSGAADEGSE